VGDPDAAEILECLDDVLRGGPTRDSPPRGPVPEPAGERVAQDRRAPHQVELPKDHPDPPPDPAKLRAARTGHVGAVEHDAPARRLDEPVDAAKERGLARTGKSDEDDEFAALDVQGDAVDAARAARIDLHQVLYLKHRPHGAESMEKKKAAGASGGLQVTRAEWLTAASPALPSSRPASESRLRAPVRRRPRGPRPSSCRRRSSA